MCGKFNNIFILLKLGWFKMLLFHNTYCSKTLIKKNFCHTKNNRRYIFTLTPHMNQLTEKERNLQKYKVFHAWHKGCPNACLSFCSSDHYLSLRMSENLLIFHLQFASRPVNPSFVLRPWIKDYNNFLF